jgi:hypothetical protein
MIIPHEEAARLHQNNESFEGNQLVVLKPVMDSF